MLRLGNRTIVGCSRVNRWPSLVAVSRGCRFECYTARIMRASFGGSTPQVLDWATLGGKNRRCCAARDAAEVTPIIGWDGVSPAA
jgi:hypothetical protein